MDQFRADVVMSVKTDLVVCYILHLFCSFCLDTKRTKKSRRFKENFRLRGTADVACRCMLLLLRKRTSAGATAISDKPTGLLC